MAQMARDLTDVATGFLPDGYHAIHDRDPLYTTELCAILEAGGVTHIRLAAQSPNLNAYAERFVRSIKEEALHRIVPLGERHLRSVVREYIEHDHEERNHQRLENGLIAPAGDVVGFDGRVARRERAGGVLSDYYREAA